MNIKITHNWLLEYLETNASPYEIQKYLSLCGPTVERVEKIDNDYLLDIEITSNRVDMASVFGIAQEASAILPMFGKRAKLKINPLEKYKFAHWSLRAQRSNLNVMTVPSNLCSRFTAIVLNNIKTASSPDFIKKRLTVCGIKSINNVVDISNYLMVALGQPVHIFDYDKIGGATMIMREAKKGEKIITLDGKEIILPGGDIVIEDGGGQLIDLCGVMGGLNSAVSPQTKRIVLFVQTYNKQKIRQTSMATGQRTMAATYFEKGLDEKRVEPTLVYGIELLQKYADAQIASKLYDIYPSPYKEKLLVISYELLDKIIGIKIDKKKIDTILQNLGFKIKHLDNDRAKMVNITPPSWRQYDVLIPEDMVEEVARIYGYHNLPNHLSPPAYVNQPKDIEELFSLQYKIKNFLKHLRLNEVMNYSMINSTDRTMSCPYLRLSNTISKEIEFMRTTLLPSLFKNIEENRGKKEILKFFEIAKVYFPRQNDLPQEVYKLGIAVNTDFFDLKGIVEALYRELNIGKEVKEEIIRRGDIFLTEIDLAKLINESRLISSYQPINPYAVIKLDLTMEQKKPYEEIKKTAFQSSKLLQNIEVVDIFKNKITLRFYFSSNKRNITESQAKEELEKIQALALE